MERIVVSNSSPLIAFQRIGSSDLLRELVERVLIPPAVRREVYGEEALPEWVDARTLSQPIAAQIMAVRLGAGEAEAIALGLEVGATVALIDDLPARRLAASLGLAVTGTAGLVLRAKERGLVPAVRPLLEELREADFRISDRLFHGILAAAGESHK